MKFWNFSFLVAMLAVGLVACGGGDGGTTTETDKGPTTDVIAGDNVTPDPDVAGDTTTPPADVPVVEDKGTEPKDEGTPPADVPVPPKDEGTCVPECASKKCGSDGCGGFCGECDTAKGEFCNDKFECEVSTCTNPTTWGPAGVVATLETPGDATKVGTMCPDFSGDGKGDNGLKGLAGTINPEIKKALDGGDFGIIFEFEGVTDFANTAAFNLNGMFGEPKEAGSSEYLIENEAYMLGTCKPLIAFADSKIAAGAMTAGPSKFILAIPIPDVGTIEFTLNDAQVKGNVAGTADGVTGTDGVLAGVLTKSEVDATLAKLEATCKEPNPPSLCSYLSVAKSFLPMLFDLDQDKDGKKDAASVCTLYTLKAGKVVGYKAADPE